MFSQLRISICLLWIVVLCHFSCKKETVFIDITGELINPRTYIIPRADQSLVIDGREEDPSWKKAPFTEDFINIEGDKIPNQKTRLKMLWDEDFLYLPKYVSYATSKDGENYSKPLKINNPHNPDPAENPDIVKLPFMTFKTVFNNTEARYLKVHAESVLKMPGWHINAGKPAIIYAYGIVVK